MMMKAPEGATPGDVFQVGVNQLVTYLNGIVGLARIEKDGLSRNPDNVAYIETDLKCCKKLSISDGGDRKSCEDCPVWPATSDQYFVLRLANRDRGGRRYR